MVKSNVRELMEKQGVTLRKMVALTRLSDVTIMRARREHIIQCRLSTLETLAKSLGCSIKDLFDEVED